MWRRRKSKGVGILIKVSALFVLLTFILAAVFVRSGFFTIKQVEIEPKDGCVDEGQLRDSSTVLGQNFFLINLSKIEADLKKKFLCIKSVIIRKSLPDKIKLQVFGRQPLAVLVTLKDKQASVSSMIENIATPSAEEVQESYLVDEEGVVFSKDTDGLNISRIYIDTKIGFGKQSDAVGNALKILDKIKTFGIATAQGWISDSFFIINPSVGEPKIIFRLSDEIDIQLASLQLILAEAKIDFSKLVFIDLRFDKPVVRVAPEK